MSVPFDHRDPGTPEAKWADAAPWRSAPLLPLDVDAVVVLAAHPDDETLGAGGLIATSHERGIPVAVIVVTDGGASHPLLDDQDQDRFARERRREVVDAVADLAPSASLAFLGFTDGRVREDRIAIEKAIRSILSGIDAPRVLIAAPWWGDGHRDHRVLGEIALGLGGASTDVVGYPIWLWHWGSPDEVDASTWQTVPLTAAIGAQKAAAIARHRTQVEPISERPGGEPIVHDGMRAHFLRPVEVFVSVGSAEPVTGESVDTAFFDDFFTRHEDPWGFESRWYERRKRAVLRASLPRERFGSTLELGCATGVLTAELAQRSARVLAVDASTTAVATARQRTAALGTVTIEQRRLPEEWPEGAFDLIVVSELVYYLGADDRAGLARRIRLALTANGVVVFCHWRRPIDGAPATGDQVHAELSRSLGMHRLARHEEADFVLEVFTVEPTSVAGREGLA